VALDRPQWLADLSRSFKRHRQGRSGWFVEVSRDRLRVVSAELPPRPDEAPDAPPKRRAFTLSTPPGPASFNAALQEACALFDAVMAGGWRWPDPDAMPGPEDQRRLAPATLQRLVAQLQQSILGERVSARTWERMYQPQLQKLIETSAQRHWPTDRELLEATLRHWQPNTRSRQMAHDRIRRLWREAGWEWPEQVSELRGNGNAAKSPEGVRAFTDAELVELRARIQRSYKLTPADLVAWDCLMVFGLRPAELKGLEISSQQGVPIAKVTREKRSSKGSSGARSVPAVPPEGWPAECFALVERWQEHGLPAAMVAHWSPGEKLAQQLARLRVQRPVQIALDSELTPYGCRHAFALRLAQQVGLHIREAAELMGHSPAVHLSTYGRRLDQPKLVDKVAQLVANQTKANNPDKKASAEKQGFSTGKSAPRR
jgi:integrase